MALKIKGWEKFQHFKNRRPPWIKLYRDLIDDPEWFALDPQSSKILIMLWLIASESQNGALPCVKKVAFRLRCSETQLKQHLTKLSHWLIQDDISVISNGYQHGSSETERETKGETETKTYPQKQNDIKVCVNGKTKKTSWPSTFTLTEELTQYALNQGIKRPEEEFENFQLKAQSKNYQYANWNAAWKSWCRSEFQQASKLEKVEYF